VEAQAKPSPRSHRCSRPRASTAHATRATLLASDSQQIACAGRHKARIAAAGRRSRKTWVACTKRVRRYLLPRLEIVPSFVRSPGRLLLWDEATVNSPRHCSCDGLMIVSLD